MPESVSKTPKPQGYHHGDLRRALLMSARALIDEGGDTALTLRRVAQQAGVSASAPYRHFADREALLAAAMCEGFDELTAELEQAYAHAASPIEAFLSVGHAYLGFAVKAPKLYRIMFGSTCERLFHDELRAAGERAFAVVVKAAVDCSKHGLTGNKDPQHIALAGWSMVHGLASLHTDGVRGLVQPGDLSEAANALFALLMEGIAPRELP